MSIPSRLLEASARRPVVAAAAVLAYTIVVAETHDHVQDAAYALQRAFGRETWAPAVAAIGGAALIAATVAVRRELARSRVRRAGACAWWTTFALLVAAFLTIQATNMEAIHYLQYALPCVPVYALTRRFSTTVLVVTALGAADETWQYAVLHSGWAVPWDANDLVLNALGAALGCSWIAVSAGAEPADPAPRRAFAPVVVAAALVLGGGLALRAAGLLSLYPEDGRPWLLLSRAARPESRWEVPDWGRGHHVLHPGAAFAIVLALASGCAALDRHVRWRPARERAA